IHLDPEVLLVDEVLAVGDYAFQQKCLGRIAELQRAGLTICLVTHFLDTVRAMCTRALWFDHGHLRADGAAEAVVRQYLDHSTAQEARRLATSAALNPNQRWGSRKVEITRVWLTDGQGREQTVFETGQPLVLHMAYHAHYPTPAPIFGMAIHRQDGLHITGPNTGFAGLELPAVEGRGEVTYTIQDLPLLDGLYQVTAVVVNQDDTEMFDYHDRAYSFRVSNLGGAVKERFGLLTFNGAWKHMPDAVSVPGIYPPQPSLSS
ncbi:MAG: Wzt carbohydrate-binding domain-containing protein, partial [Anaerolineales bacterium]